MEPAPEGRAGAGAPAPSFCRTSRRPRRPAPALARRPSPLLAAAQRAATAGLHVFPLWPGTKVPTVEGWEDVATCDADRVRDWWTQYPWNIGIATGPSGLLVVDLDVGRGDLAPPEWAGAQGGRDVLAQLAAAHAQPTPEHTLTVLTPSGGRHLYFRQPPGLELRNTAGRLGWRVDTRGHGGYVVGPGSRRGDATYRVLHAGDVVELPGWLATALTPPPPLPPPARAPGPGRTTTSSGRAAAYLQAVVDGECAAVAAAPVGERHQILLRAARRLGHWVGGGALGEGEAREVLAAAAAHYIGVKGYTSRQVERDIDDGLDYGARLPRTLDDLPPRAAG